MIIQDVITLAKYSELSGVSSKNDIDAIVSFMNLGMIELYKRFPIKVEEHLIALYTNELFYTMPSDFMYAVTVYGEAEEGSSDQSVVVPINDDSDPLSVFFTSWNQLQVPAPETGSYLSLIYIAKPERITSVQAADGITELAIPDTLVDALLSFIGFRGHLGVKSDSQSENNAHWKRFERNCDKAIELGVATPADTMNMPGRITDRGFA